MGSLSTAETNQKRYEMKLSLNTAQLPFLRRIRHFCRNRIPRARWLLEANVYFGKYVDRVPNGSIVFFPFRQTMLCCGIAGIVTFKNKPKERHNFNFEPLAEMAREMEVSGYQSCKQTDRWNDCYLGGSKKIDAFWRRVQALKTDAQFFSVFSDEKAQNQLERLANHLGAIIQTETDLLAEQMGRLSAECVDLISLRIEKLKDIAWSLDREREFPSCLFLTQLNFKNLKRLSHRPVYTINSRIAVSLTP
jgi:hypothetical protein